MFRTQKLETYGKGIATGLGRKSSVCAYYRTIKRYIN